MRLSFGHKLAVAFGSAVAILLATAVVSYRNTRELLATTASVSRSQEILGALDGVLGSALDAESAARAYAPIGGAAHRDRFERARRDIQRDLSTLATMGRDRTAAGQEISDVVSRRLRQLEATMSRRDSGLATPVAAFGGHSAEPSGVDSVRWLIGSFQERERLQLRSTAAAAHVTADRSGFILRFGFVLMAILAPLAFFMVRNDFEVRRNAARSLQESESRFRAAADGSLDAFYVLRAIRDRENQVMDFEFVDLNARAESLLGHARDGIVGQRLCELIPVNRSAGFFDKYRRVLENSAVLEEEVEVMLSDYGEGWIHHQVVPLVDGVAITSRDITERKRQEEALRALSLIDELTGLYNRRGFMTLATQQLKIARRGHRELVLLFVDMDDFKEINDTFGHREGDVALNRAAGILKKTFRDSDIIARMGGDEFVVLATDTVADGSEIVINRLRRELSERNAMDGFPYRLSFSVGAARFDPLAPPTIEELLATADAMLYDQKRHKRATEPAAV
jgi:diguanylate cyclase (GGDEF)-like protein/PAS domain S-box-containing protein